MCVYTFVYVCTCVCVHVRVCEHVRVCVCACVSMTYSLSLLLMPCHSSDHAEQSVVRALSASTVVDLGSTLHFNYWCLGNTFFEESGCGLEPPGTACL